MCEYYILPYYIDTRELRRKNYKKNICHVFYTSIYLLYYDTWLVKVPSIVYFSLCWLFLQMKSNFSENMIWIMKLYNNWYVREFALGFIDHYVKIDKKLMYKQSFLWKTYSDSARRTRRLHSYSLIVRPSNFSIVFLTLWTGFTDVFDCGPVSFDRPRK